MHEEFPPKKMYFIQPLNYKIKIMYSRKRKSKLKINRVSATVQ